MHQAAGIEKTVSSVADEMLVNPSGILRHKTVRAGRFPFHFGVRTIFLTVAAGVVSIGIVVFAAQRAMVEEEHVECSFGKPISARATALNFKAPSPSTFLDQARQQMKVASAEKRSDAASFAKASTAMAAAKRSLEACAFWEPKSLATKMHMTDVRSQLECQGILVEQFVGTDIDSAAVGEQSLELFYQARTVLQRCADIASELQTLRRSAKVSASSGEALSLLSMLGNLERPATDALEGLSWSQRLMERETQTAVEENEAENDLDEEDSAFDDIEENLSSHQIVDMRIGLRHCLLRVVREARAVSGGLFTTSPQVRRVMKCRPHMLGGVESLALREASMETDPGVKFSLGMYHSELALATSEAGTSATPTVAIFAKPSVLQGSGDSMHLVAIAEDLLLLGEQASSGASESERRFMRAKRMVQHAYGVFTPLGLHAMVASRFRQASAIFVSLGNTKLAAQTLSDLAEHEFSFGDHAASLAYAGEALAIDHSEPVALYLQATLRRSLGELRTEEDVHFARQQLEQVAGRLPGELESRRAVAYEELVGWAAVAEAGTLSKCVELPDVASVLICAMCRLAYA